MNKKTMWFGTFALLGCLVGCEGSDVPIGQDDEDETTSHASPLLASWTGYVELYELRSGSDAITIDIDTVNGTEITGRVTFGSDPALAPPQSSEVGYPENASFGDDLRAPFEGYAFTIKDSKLIDGERLQFTINTRELWGGWCEMQTTTYPSSFDQSGETLAWTCEEPTVWHHGEGESCSRVDPSTGEPVPADCWKAELCARMVCECDAEGCVSLEQNAQLAKYFDLTFDIQMSQEHGDGSIIGLQPDGAPRNVRVNKVD